MVYQVNNIRVTKTLGPRFSPCPFSPPNPKGHSCQGPRKSPNPGPPRTVPHMAPSHSLKTLSALQTWGLQLSMFASGLPDALLLFCNQRRAGYRTFACCYEGQEPVKCLGRTDAQVLSTSAKLGCNT